MACISYRVFLCASLAGLSAALPDFVGRAGLKPRQPAAVEEQSDGQVINWAINNAMYSGDISSVVTDIVTATTSEYTTSTATVLYSNSSSILPATANATVVVTSTATTTYSDDNASVSGSAAAVTDSPATPASAAA